MSQLTPQILLRAYAAGIFPMAESRDDPRLYWIDPEMRGLLPLEKFHVPKSLRRTIKHNVFEVHCDKAFAEVMRGCAEPTSERPNTWINREIVALYRLTVPAEPERNLPARYNICPTQTIDVVIERDGKHELLVPVLAQRDRAMIDSVVQRAMRVVSTWTAASYQRIRSELASITPPMPALKSCSSSSPSCSCSRDGATCR